MFQLMVLLKYRIKNLKLQFDIINKLRNQYYSVEFRFGYEEAQSEVLRIKFTSFIANVETRCPEACIGMKLD